MAMAWARNDEGRGVAPALHWSLPTKASLQLASSSRPSSPRRWLRQQPEMHAIGGRRAGAFAR
jgi:hypothetical protein